MGFFKWIARGLGSVIESVGDFLGSDTISRIGEKVYDWGADYDKMDYDESSSSSEDIIRNDRVFQDAYRNLEQSVKDDERKKINQIAKEIEECANVLLNEFPFQSGIEEIQRIHDNCRAELHELFDGKYVEYASERFSMDNTECQKAMLLSVGRVEQLMRLAKDAQSYAKKKLDSELIAYKDNEISRMLSIEEDAARELQNYIDESEERIKNLKEKNKDEDSLNMEIAKQLIKREKMLLLRDFLTNGNDTDLEIAGDQLES